MASRRRWSMPKRCCWLDRLWRSRVLLFVDVFRKECPMHKSRLAGFIIDCQTHDLDAASRFWGEALGYEVDSTVNPPEANYQKLSTGPTDMHIEVQQVAHPSRVHLDIESDDIEAEAQRLE